MLLNPMKGESQREISLSIYSTGSSANEYPIAIHAINL
jgi:hypothetical protein